MSRFDVHRAVQARADITDADKVVFTAMMLHANRKLIAWPSASTIARGTGKGIRAVRYCLKRLKAAGVIHPVGRQQNDEHAGHATIRYQLSGGSGVQGIARVRGARGCTSNGQSGVQNPVVRGAKSRRQGCTGLHTNSMNSLNSGSARTHDKQDVQADAIRIFDEVHRQSYPRSRTTDTKTNRGLIAKALESCGGDLDELRARAVGYHERGDRFTQDNGHTLRLFGSQNDKYASRAESNGFSDAVYQGASE